MKAGCALITLAMPRARVFKREPYVVALFTAGGTELQGSCQPLPAVKRGRPFVGSVQLLPSTELGPFVVGRIEVWESDRGFRAVGQRIESVLEEIERRPTLSSLADAAGTLALGPARVGITSAAAILGRALLKAKDDYIAGFDVEVETSELRIGETFQLSSPRAALQLMVTDGPPGQGALFAPDPASPAEPEDFPEAPVNFGRF